MEKEITSALCIDLLKQKLYISMSPTNEVLPFPETETKDKCEVCGSKATWVGKDGSAWCEDHVHSANDTEVKRIGSKSTPEGQAAKDASEKADEGRHINNKAAARGKKQPAKKQAAKKRGPKKK